MNWLTSQHSLVDRGVSVHVERKRASVCLNEIIGRLINLINSTIWHTIRQPMSLTLYYQIN